LEGVFIVYKIPSGLTFLIISTLKLTLEDQIPFVPTLYYVADPMCSWCWGFAPVLDNIVGKLPHNVKLQYVMGGLARDSDEPMPEEVRSYVQNAWRKVSATTDARFNWEFWELCQPRRSTYPACRAALAGGLQGVLPEMFAALQRAYYLEARNPSDASTHLAMAGELGLDEVRFEEDLVSPRVEDLLQNDFAKRRELGVCEFPSLIFENGAEYHSIVRGWATLDAVRERLEPHLTSVG
jgi:putative protein-disulfide isomerase